MRTLLLTALSIGLSLSGMAQQKQRDTTVAQFKPPVIIKSNETDKTATEKETTFKPPVIVKDKPHKKHNKKSSRQTKFQPPVIIKNEEIKQD